MGDTIVTTYFLFYFGRGVVKGKNRSSFLFLVVLEKKGEKRASVFLLLLLLCRKEGIKEKGPLRVRTHESRIYVLVAHFLNFVLRVAGKHFRVSSFKWALACRCDTQPLTADPQ